MKKYVSFILIISMIFIATGTTFLRLKKEHDDNKWYVLEKNVLENAMKCKNEDICLDEKVNIRYLVDNGYLYDVINPLTKEVINYNSYVDYVTNKFVVVE